MKKKVLLSSIAIIFLFILSITIYLPRRINNNLVTYGKIYGYVRFFHPSKEAEDLDWDRFAIYGVSKVKYALTGKQLSNRLNELFQPIAPYIRITTKPTDYVYKPNDVKSMVHYKHQGFTGILETDMYSSRKIPIPLSTYITLTPSQQVTSMKLSNHIYITIPHYLSNEDSILKTPIKNATYIELIDRLSRIKTDSDQVSNSSLRLADIIITWNYIQHLYPYKENMNINWDEYLSLYLKSALPNMDGNDFCNLLKEMTEPLNDAHTGVYSGRFETFDSLISHWSNSEYLPIRLDYIEGKVVVVNSMSDKLSIGDTVTHVNGKEVLSLMNEKIKLISGSEQHKVYAFLEELITKSEEDTCSINGIELRYQNELLNRYPTKDHGESLGNGIYYVRADHRLTSKDLDIIHDNRIKGLIVDCRAYPNDYKTLVDTLSLQDGTQFSIPVFTLPNQRDVTYKQGTYKGKDNGLEIPYIVLIDAETKSQAEMLPSYVYTDNPRALVGQPTAGVDGNINGFCLPGNYTVTLTGTYVENADGSCSHGIGIPPYYLVDRTIKGIKEGRDEYIDKAIDVLINSTND